MGIYGHKFDNFRTDLHPEIFQEDIILYEFDFKQTIDKIKSAIKRAILNLVDKIDNWLDKHKDSKIKSFIQGLLTKVRKLLVKADDIETESDAKYIAADLNEYKSEFDEKTKVEFKHEDVHISESELNKIKEYVYKKIDFSINIAIFNDKKDLKLDSYDLKEIYENVYKKGKYIFGDVQISTINILTDKLLDLPLYDRSNKGIPSGVQFEAAFRGNIHKSKELSLGYANELGENFKPLKYNGQSIEKYYNDAKEYIVKCAVQYAKQIEIVFNKVVKDIEIKEYQKEKAFNDKLDKMKNNNK